jgi:cytoskeletal protein CcmA (bactofilin family)
MFGIKNTNKESESPVVSKAASKDVKTLIGEGCKVEGNFYIPSFTRIDGTIKGDVTGESGLIIGNNGYVNGNIYAAEVLVYGKVTGNIESQRVELKKGSHLDGDISVNHFLAESGCYFNGKCNMKQESESANVTELPNASIV